MSALAPVAALLVGVAILVMGNGLQSTLLPVRAQIESFSLLEIGILGSAYFVGFAFGCLTGSRLIHRAGHIRVFTAMAAVASAVALAHALIVLPVIWLPLRAITGFCFAVLYIVIESWLNERSTNETRGLVMSLYTAISLADVTLGQLMITIYDPAAFPLFALASILVSLAAVPVALTAAPAPAPLAMAAARGLMLSLAGVSVALIRAFHARSKRPDLIRARKVRTACPPAMQIPRLRIAYLFRLSPVGFLGCCAVGAVGGSFLALAPVFAQRSGLGIGGIALFMSATAIGGALGQWPFGRMSDKMDRRKVIAAICLAACLTAIALSMVNDRWPQSILYFALLFGIFVMPLYAICVAHMNDFVSADGFVEASSGLLLVFSAGGVCGPLIATGFMAWLGMRPSILLFGIFAMPLYGNLRGPYERPYPRTDREASSVLLVFSAGRGVRPPDRDRFHGMARGWALCLYRRNACRAGRARHPTDVSPRSAIGGGAIRLHRRIGRRADRVHARSARRPDRRRDLDQGPRLSRFLLLTPRR